MTPSTPPDPPTAERLERHAELLDDITRGRSSGALFAVIFIVPLGIAFFITFALAMTLFAGVLTLIGLSDSTFAGLAALLGAIACAVAAVVVVYRRLIPRLPWLRRLVNRRADGRHLG